MKPWFPTAACSSLLLFAAACHNSDTAPTQPAPPPALTQPGPTTPTPPAATPPPTPAVTPTPSAGATSIVNVGPGFLFMDTQSGTSATTIKVGDTVQWNFVDSMAHTTTSGKCCTASGIWDSGIKSSGSFSHKFSTAGVFPYFCSVHGALMTGTVTVNP